MRAAAITLAAAAALGPTGAAADAGLHLEQRLADRAAWVVTDGRRTLYGEQSHVRSVPGAGQLVREMVLPLPAMDAALIGRRIFLALSDGTIWVAEVDDAAAPAARFALEPPPALPLRLAHAGATLVAADAAGSLRFLVPISGQDHHHHHGDRRIVELREAARYDAPAPIVAVTGSGAGLLAATAAGELLELEAADPTAPRLVRSRALVAAPRALVANGTWIYALGDDGLRVLPRSGDGAVRHDPAVRGEALALAGRSLLVGGAAGVLGYRDLDPTGALHPVTVANDFYQPEELAIAVGDTVRWSNLSGLHNVFSCVPGQNGCASEAQERFSSGPPELPIWIFDHTFVAEGFNPYICQSHAPFMIGLVVAGSPTVAPPAVPDGRVGSPVLVGKQNATGSNLRVWWDASTCPGATGHHLLWGVGSQLPETPGASYRTGGSRCLLGPPPFTWLLTPPADRDVSDLVWFLVVADDGTAEGSWGTDSAGSERQSVYPGGASRQCGLGVKDLSNLCGQ